MVTHKPVPESAAHGQAYAAVVGHPISHSRSPELHTAAYGVLGAELVYRAVDLTESELPGHTEQLRGDPLWRGLSVTMPLKSQAASLCDDLTSLARVVGVVNTVIPAGQGRLMGHNTDVAGIIGAVRAAGAVPSKPRVAILGGGGTATAAVVAAQGLGAGAVDVWVRSFTRAHRVVAAARAAGVALDLKPWEQAVQHLTTYDVVVATLPPHGCDELAAALKNIPENTTTGVLLDVAYDPWPSAIAQAWTNVGGHVAAGLEMLIFQAVDQIAMFTGVDLSNNRSRRQAVVDAMCAAVGRASLPASP